MNSAEVLITGLMVVVALLTAAARWLGVPYPVVLVVGGALLGFVPGLPEVRLDPQVVLVVVLPPLLYSESIFANFGDFRAICAGSGSTPSRSCSRRGSSCGASTPHDAW